jgi:hypothetical protein
MIQHVDMWEMCCIRPTKSGDCCVSSWENDVHDLDDVEVDDDDDVMMMIMMMVMIIII